MATPTKNDSYIDQLIESYRPIYESNVRDFNVLTTVHLSENDHTNILCEILNMKDGKEKPFMKSFVEVVLGIVTTEDFVAKTQIASIGINDKGYIDLLLESPKTCIVIENKVCGAGDMDYQLLRYYYTYVAPDDNDKKDILSGTKIEKQVTVNYWNKKIIKAQKEVFIVYLTETMDKQPDTKSLPEELKTKLGDHYIHISYERHIYKWLKYYVQPNIKQGKNEDAAKSIDLYLHELENILGAETAQKEWYYSIKDRIIEEVFHGKAKVPQVKQFIFLNPIYKKLDKASKKKKYNENIYLLDLKSCVKYNQESIYKGFTPEKWTIRCAESYVDIFPSKWLKKFGGTAKSSIHFSVNNWQDSKQPRIELNIHDEAYRKYLNANKDQIMASIKDKLNSFSPKENYKKGKDSCDIVLKLNNNFQWNPDNPKDFFEDFAKNDQIQAFVALAENDFKVTDNNQ